MMGKKIFVSYKYADDLVQNLEDGVNSTVRDYVTKFEEKLADEDDIYKGDVPGIKSIECTEKIAPEDVRITVVYSGRNEEISLSRSCLLSEGYEAVNKLFEGLEEGSYRLTVKAESKNEKYMGITTFYFSVLE